MTQRYDLAIQQGAVFEREFQWCNPIPGSDPPEPNEADPIDLTGYTAKLQIRAHGGEPDTTDPLAEFTIGSGLTVTAAEGKIALKITDEQTTAYAFTTAVWDLLVATGGDTIRLVEGRVSVSPEVTR